jgi:hypothetical protein
MVCFQYLIKAEKSNLKEEKTKLVLEKQEFEKDKKHDQESLFFEKANWEQNKMKVD